MLPAMGITRLANLTGLDRVGIPVCAATRPNARSVSVAQGKGVSLQAAAASATMEAIEGFHAETIHDRAVWATRADLESAGRICVVDGLGASGRRLNRRTPIRWIEGQLIGNGARCWVPLEVVSTDFRVPRPSDAGFFPASSNGLASGNHPIEAAIAGICELIERDAAALWARQPPDLHARRVLNPDTIDYGDAVALLHRFRRRRLAITIWDITSDLGVATFQCRVGEPAQRGNSTSDAVIGFGCHPDRRIALVRALTEAAQARLTLIAGARDDLTPRHYARSDADKVWQALADLRPASGARQCFSAVPNFLTDDLCDDLAWLRQRLADAGLATIIVVDLTRPEFSIPVMRLIVPGLEGPHDHPRYRPGARARAVHLGRA
jgi:ribosomal protein S12 methylthiotransferase accessory factor